MGKEEKLKQAFNDLLKDFINDEIKALNSGIDGDVDYVDPAEVDYDYSFCRWIEEQLDDFAEDVDWDEVKDSILKKLDAVK